MKRLGLILVSAALALSFSAAGCGGSASCGVKPCGGDVVGNWQASSACVDRATLNMEFLTGVMDACPTASLGNVTTTPTGNLSFAADMSFTGTLAVDSTIPLNFPASCIAGATCSQLTAALQTVVGMGGITAVSCAGSGSCTCTMAQTLNIVQGPGSWSGSGNTLVVTDAAGVQDDGVYCVQGTSLHLLDLDMPTMMKVVGDVVLSKT
jgi:hypothetical protein